MFKWTHEVWHGSKWVWARSVCLLSAIVLAAGCHAIPDAGDQIDPRPTNPEAVSVYPKVPESASGKTRPSNNESLVNEIVPAQATASRYTDKPSNSTGQTALMPDASRSG